MDRKTQIMKLFADIEENERILIDPLIDEVVFLEIRMAELRKMPFLSVNPKNQAMQKPTAAARQYKECSQSYMNAIRILLSLLHRIDSDAEDELMKRLEEFA